MDEKRQDIKLHEAKILDDTLIDVSPPLPNMPTQAVDGHAIAQASPMPQDDDWECDDEEPETKPVTQIKTELQIEIENAARKITLAASRNGKASNLRKLHIVMGALIARAQGNDNITAISEAINMHRVNLTKVLSKGRKLEEARGENKDLVIPDEDYCYLLFWKEWNRFFRTTINQARECFATAAISDPKYAERFLNMVDPDIRAQQKQGEAQTGQTVQINHTNQIVAFISNPETPTEQVQLLAHKMSELLPKETWQKIYDSLPDTSREKVDSMVEVRP